MAKLDRSSIELLGAPAVSSREEIMKSSAQQFSKHVSVLADEGIRVDKTITIVRPVHEVYAFWRKLENLPRFMRHVRKVVVNDDLHSHWEVKGLGGKRLEWDAEIIQQRENEMISWRSAPGADVDHAGSVWFSPAPDGHGTKVRVELMYAPPAGKAGALLAKLFRRDAEADIEEDLQRLKSLLETGRLPQNGDGSLSAWRRRAVETTRKAAVAADNYVHENPWSALIPAAVTGFLIGILVGRSRD